MLLRRYLREDVVVGSVASSSHLVPRPWSIDMDQISVSRLIMLMVDTVHVGTLLDQPGGGGYWLLLLAL